MTNLSTRPLGRSDLVIPEICLGTMTFGEQTSEADAHAQLDYALAQGVNFIDTAEMYAVPPRAETYGATETIVGNMAQAPATRQDHPRHQGRWSGAQPDLDP